MSRPPLATWCAASLLLLAAGVARADGAFPDSSQLYAPAGTERLLLTTNFGLVVSEDDGRHWSWVCEEAVGRNAFLYAPAAPPSELVWAVDLDGRLVRSVDAGRSWAPISAETLGAGRRVTDVFADPNDPARAIAAFVGPDEVSGILETNDAGEAFRLVQRAPPGWRVESLEISPLDGRSLTAVLLQPGITDAVSKLIRSDDNGLTWRSVGLTPSLGRRQVRIAALDRRRPDTTWLRVRDAQPGSDALAVVRGDSVATVLATNGPMSTFLQLDDGTYAVAALEGGAWRSDDGEQFAPWATAPRLRGLAQREGVLYAAGDAFRDGFAVARSLDHGATWEAFLRWERLCGVLPSLALEQVCAGPWQTTVVDRWGNAPPEGCPPPATPPPSPVAEPFATESEADVDGCACSTGGELTWLVLLPLFGGRARTLRTGASPRAEPARSRGRCARNT
ncbi:MAG: hypothetical protein RL199_2027 [Pseudomonadota bacterium]|jgi:hypothetical protein